MNSPQTVIITEETDPCLAPFIPEFLADRKRELAMLKESITQSNYDSLRQIGHNWKGYCAPYGFGQLASLGEDLEHKSISEDIESCSKLVLEIEVYLEKKTKQLLEV